MLNTKRKNSDADTGPPKKKKVQFKENKSGIKGNETPNSKIDSVKLSKGKFQTKPKTDAKNNKFGQKSNPKNKENKFIKPKGSFEKGNKGKFSKGTNSKGKPNFSKEQEQSEKPKWAEMKKEKKNLRLIRRKAKATAEVFEISHKAKLLSAQIQRKVVKQEFREKACKELHSLLKGQYKSIALTHDLSRVIQVLLKHGPEDIKNDISEELLDIMVQMMQSKYAQHAIKRIIKYGTDFIRHEVIKKLFGHIISLATHSVSAPVLDYAYGEFATKKEKLHMQQEFYGELYKNSKDDKVKTLSDAYKNSPEMKAAILQACRANIQKILDKNLHDSELFQTVLYDYIRECTQEDKVELISALSPLIVPLSNSLPGVNTASICVWQGTNKDKKTILKVVKEHVVSLSKHKTAYRLLITIFDAVDDTVLVKKAIISTIASNLKDITKDHWGKMVVHWLVKPKDPAAFHPSFIKFLEDGAKSGASKKDSELRVAEIREAVLPVLKEDMVSDAQFWLSSKANLLLTVALLSIESSKEILEALAKVISQSDWSIKVEDKSVLAIEDAGIHMCLKKLACLDKDKNEGTLGEVMCEHLNDDAIEAWVPTNRGCFFLLKLIENNSEKISKKIIKKIKSHSNLIKQQSSEGAKLLLQKIQNK